MREATKFYSVLSHTEPGKVYYWGDLKAHSKSPSRDVHRLLDKGLLRKVGPGMYLRLKKTRFGDAALSNDELVKSFLKTNDYLLVPVSLYNGLGLGLTQLRNTVYVYNNKRHENILLSNRTFCFKRTNNGYPKKLTAEFLLVDLVNNIKFTGENTEVLMEKITKKILADDFDKKLLHKLASRYGKVATRKFFLSLTN